MAWRLFAVAVCLVACRPLSDEPCTAADGGHPDGEPVPVAPSCTSGCDEPAARSIVYDTWGRPMYAGQAVMLQSCAGGGSLCHASGAVDRMGAPFQLDYDLFPVRRPSESGVSSEDELERLGVLQRAVVHTRQTMWDSILTGSMPPGAAGASVERLHFGWVHDATMPATDTLVPSITTPLGREILRNWLACRAPVVERFEISVPPACTEDATCASRRCVSGVCTAVGETALRISRPIEPTWTAIFAQIVEPGCLGSACHGTSAVRGPATAAGLDLFDLSGARTALVGVTSDTETCAGETLVAIGDPAGSLLYAKIDPSHRDVCGVHMPPGPALPPEALTAVRTWITAGAPE